MVNLNQTGKFIAECRKKKQLTQKQLGEKLHVTDRAVSKWENGKAFPDVHIMEDLCRELDISVSELLAGKRIERDGETADDGGRQVSAVWISDYHLHFNVFFYYSLPATPCPER